MPVALGLALGTGLTVLLFGAALVSGAMMTIRPTLDRLIRALSR